MIRTKLVNGKKEKIVIDSGVPHNPPPYTERGKRRRAKKEEAKKTGTLPKE